MQGHGGLTPCAPFPRRRLFHASGRPGQGPGGARPRHGCGDDGAWLDGDAARVTVCDALITLSSPGDVDLGVLDDLVALCLRLANHGAHRAPQPDADPADEPAKTSLEQLTATSREAIRQAIIGKTVILLMHSRLLLDLQESLVLSERAKADSWHVEARAVDRHIPTLYALTNTPTASLTANGKNCDTTLIPQIPGDSAQSMRARRCRARLGRRPLRLRWPAQ